MSDKAASKLNPIDSQVRLVIARTSMAKMGEDGTPLTIAFVSGFERFNTRPYHNYETWGQGWRVEGRGITVEREDLDDAINEWEAKVTAAYCEAPR